MLATTLTSFTFDVTCATSGREAIDAIEKQDKDKPFDLVLMDWKMPGLDGLEVSKHIKEHTSASLTPTIIMVTAYGREEVMHKAQDVGLDGFLINHSLPQHYLIPLLVYSGKKAH